MAEIYFDVDAALSEVPVNIFPLTDDTDFKTRETGITYDQAGMDLVWNFVTTSGAYTQTAVTPTTGGSYDWTHQGDGMYSIEIPASGGASINNDTEGFGWFTGVCTGVLPWRSPIFCFRASGINDKLIDDAYSVTRGLAGTALPAAAADAAGGLAISDAGGLDLDSKLANTDQITVARMAVLTDWINGGRLDLLLDAIKAITDQINFTGTYINTQVKAQDNIDFGALQKSSLNAATPASVTGSVGSVSGNVGGNVVGSVGSVTSGVTVTTNNDKTGYSLTVTPPTAADIANAVWGAATRTLSSFGSLVSDVATAVWGAVSRTITGNSDKTGYSISGTKQTLDALNDFDHATDIVARVTLVDTTTANTDMRGTDGAYTGTPPTVEAIQSGLAKTTDITALNDITVADILAGQTEAGLTLAHAMQIMTALALKASGGGSSTISFRNYGDTKNRITMTVDENGNRSSVVVSFD